MFLNKKIFRNIQIIFKRDFRTEKTNVYFHNFHNQKIPDCFDASTFKNTNQTAEDICSKIKEILNINRNTPMQAYAIKNIKKLKYSWLYDINRNGYGPKRNFKLLNDDSVISKYENILVNYHHSQFNEDFIIRKIFDKIGSSNKYFVEFGACDGQVISNVALLRHDGWKGLLIEPVNPFAKGLVNAVCIRDFLTPENIESVFDREAVPQKLDFLSIDIDGNDYYIWEALNKYKPRVLCIEVDGESSNIKKLPGYNEENNGKPKCSILVMTELCEKKEYKLIYNNKGNAFYLNNKDYFCHFKPKNATNWNEPYVATVNLF